MRNFRLLCRFLLLIGTFKIIVESKSSLHNTINLKHVNELIRVSRSVNNNVSPQIIPQNIRICQNRLTSTLKSVCSNFFSTLPGLGIPNNEISNYLDLLNQDIPRHSNIVDACCNNVCSWTQLIHYCKEFRFSSHPSPTPVHIQQPQAPQQDQQEANSNPGFSTTLRYWTKLRKAEQMPIASEMISGGGEDTASLDDFVSDYR